MRINDKKRFISSILIISIGLISIFNICFARLNKAISTEEYVVSKGDTLWSIASEYKAEGQDIREYIYQIRELNNLDDCLIYPNQVIKIIK